MDVGATLSLLLGIAVLLPLASFFAIFIAGRWMGTAGAGAGYVATGAIIGSLLLSLAAMGVWLTHHAPLPHGEETAQAEEHAEGNAAEGGHEDAAHEEEEHAEAQHAAEHHAGEMVAYTDDWYKLAQFGGLRLSIGYYIDALTVAMFCMVTLIATCIHFYSTGYMHEELHDVTDHEVTLADGSHLKRPGRYHRFFQYLSLFCFSMLGLVVSGNVAMTFVFWELVGICSYFLIGFYIERKSACNAANKAFIVNRIGDFGMLIGMMALWSAVGTFNYGEIVNATEYGEAGLFSMVRPADRHHALINEDGTVNTPDGFVELAAREEIAEIVRGLEPPVSQEAVSAAVAPHLEEWRQSTPESPRRYRYWLLVVAGVGIFCGCVGKSAQFPLHVWLPDAMEGPTPVSALVHSATMVAAGVFLVARFYPVFTPEVLLVISIVGAITLLLAATIAITAVDIKRVLAYSTVSQLGYMMLSLGLGGWLAGVLHLFTHAFFKSLLFMCSGSVIHAVHTNDMREMGGLRKKMPWTAYTMLVGCLAIAGAGFPMLIGFSGYYSKDAILEHALSFRNNNPGGLGSVFFLVAAGGAAITSFYMFRLWFMTFAGEPRDEHKYEHAHESPPVMYVPLVVLAMMAVGVAWGPGDAWLGTLLIFAGYVAGLVYYMTRAGKKLSDLAAGMLFVPVTCAVVFLLSFAWLAKEHVTLGSILEQARPLGTLADTSAVWLSMLWPNEHASHALEVKFPASIVAFSTAAAGFLLAMVFYGLRLLDPAEVRQQFAPVYRLLWNKWYFDELYDWLFVRPVLRISEFVAGFDIRIIDGFIDRAALAVRWFASFWDWLADRVIVEGVVNGLAHFTYNRALSLRKLQTGHLRQYVLFIVVGMIGVFVLVMFFWGAQPY